MKRLAAFVASVLLVGVLAGCIPIMIHGAMTSEAEQKAAYSAYLDNMRQINLQREIAGLTNQPVLTRPEWRKTVVNTRPPLRSPNAKP